MRKNICCMPLKVEVYCEQLAVIVSCMPLRVEVYCEQLAVIVSCMPLRVEVSCEQLAVIVSCMPLRVEVYCEQLAVIVSCMPLRVEVYCEQLAVIVSCMPLRVEAYCEQLAVIVSCMPLRVEVYCEQLAVIVFHEWKFIWIWQLGSLRHVCNMVFFICIPACGAPNYKYVVLQIGGIDLRGGYFSFDILSELLDGQQMFADWALSVSPVSCKTQDGYLSQCWPISMTLYGVSGPQWVNLISVSKIYTRSISE